MKKYNVQYLKTFTQSDGKIKVLHGGVWQATENTTVHTVHEPTGDLLRVKVSNIDCENYGQLKLNGYTDIKTGYKVNYFITSVKEICACNKLVFVLGYENEIAGEECSECGEIYWHGEYAKYDGVIPSSHPMFNPPSWNEKFL